MQRRYVFHMRILFSIRNPRHCVKRHNEYLVGRSRFNVPDTWGCALRPTDFIPRLHETF